MKTKKENSVHILHSRNILLEKKYIFLNDFKVRQAICKIRISAHPLMIEIGRCKNLETEERLCKLHNTKKLRMNIIF